MAKVVKESNGLKNGNLVDGDSRGVGEQVNEEEPSESTSLLGSRKGGISRIKSTRKARQKVQWNDYQGDKLAQVFEYQPSDESDSDDSVSDSCMCTIM